MRVLWSAHGSREDVEPMEVPAVRLRALRAEVTGHAAVIASGGPIELVLAGERPFARGR